LVPAGLVVRGDRRRVEQVIANLVENALRYGEPPVVVSAHDHGQEIVVAVSDRGPGVPEEEREALFARLTLTGLPRRSTAATGIGLALVRGLVEAMGGRAWYDAAGDQGARFCFTLPSA
jgi:signal transduction histidine kinase